MKRIELSPSTTIRSGGLAPPAGDGVQRPIAFFLIDESASMNGARRDAVLDARCDAERVFALSRGRRVWTVDIGFAERARLIRAPRHADARMFPHRLEAAGLTSIHAGMRKMLRALASLQHRLRKSGSAGGPVAALLCSDGGANTGPAPLALARSIRDRHGIALVTVSFGQDTNHPLLSRIAYSPHHAYRAVAGSELCEIFHWFACALASASSRRDLVATLASRSTRAS